MGEVRDLKVAHHANHGEMIMPENAARSPIILLAALVILVSNVAALAQSDMPKSKVCSADDGGWSVAGGVPSTGRIVMNNDGGWCGQRLGVRNNSLVFGGAMHLTRQPAHGEVSIIPRDDGTDVYYKPSPGYTGPDSFGVLVELFNIDKPYNVVVE
jgi:hypothetical protein